MSKMQLVILVLVALLQGLTKAEEAELYIGKEGTFDIEGRGRLQVVVTLGDMNDGIWYNSVTQALVIESHLLSNENVISGSNSSRLNLAALNGDKSRSWGLTSDNPNSTVTLCIDKKGLLDSAKPEVLVVAHNPRSEGQVRLILKARVDDIALPTNRQFHVEVSVARPLTNLVRYSQDPTTRRGDRLYLLVKDDGRTQDVCMIVTVYNQACPLKDRPSNYHTAQMYAFGLTNVAMTIRTDKFKFSEPFYISVIILSNDSACHTLPKNFFDNDVRFMSQNSVIQAGQNRSKRISIELTRLPSSTTYALPIAVYFVGVLFLILFGFISMCGKQYESTKTSDKNDTTATAKQSAQEPSAEGDELIDNKDGEPSKEQVEEEEQSTNGNAIGDLESGQGFNDSMVTIVKANGDTTVEGETDIDGNALSGEREQDILRQWSVIRRRDRGEMRDFRRKVGLLRMKESPKLADMIRLTSSDIWFRRSRSKVYFYLVPLLSLFYFIPAIQFVALAKETEEMTGSKDFCFHNYRCSKPWYYFSDFNHIVSNMSYFFFGIAFMVIVRIKASKLPDEHNPRVDHDCDRGIMQQLSIFYAMGLALILQTFFSACYHVCPTNLSLQFDTTMMYIICILGYMKIYQFRHPDATLSAYVVFAGLGVLVFLEALILYFSTIIWFLVFWSVYVAVTIFWSFDQYYVGVGRLDKNFQWLLIKDYFNGILGKRSDDPSSNPRNKIDGIHMKSRHYYAYVFLVINLLNAAKIMWRKLREDERRISNELLVILAGNLVMYLVYYIVMKTIKEYQDFLQTQDDTESTFGKFLKYMVGLRHKYHFGPAGSGSSPRPYLTFPISSGTFFTLFSLCLGGIALYFYNARSANRNLSAAESRDLNEDCVFLDFYDNHDLWHFFSGAGIFMAFLALLTVDDNLMNTPRDEIPVI